MEETRKRLKLAKDSRALCIFDNFKAQCTNRMLKLLEDNNIDIVFVPANCTGELQPMGLSVNKSVKDFMHSKFEEWYATEVFHKYKGPNSEIQLVKCDEALVCSVAQGNV